MVVVIHSLIQRNERVEHRYKPPVFFTNATLFNTNEIRFFLIYTYCAYNNLHHHIKVGEGDDMKHNDNDYCNLIDLTHRISSFQVQDFCHTAHDIKSKHHRTNKQHYKNNKQNNIHYILLSLPSSISAGFSKLEYVFCSGSDQESSGAHCKCDVTNVDAEFWNAKINGIVWKELKKKIYI